MSPIKMNMKCLCITYLILLNTCIVLAQSIENRKEFTLRIGLSYNSINDARLSAISQKSWSPIYGMSYRKTSDNSINQINFDFTQTKSNGNDLLRVNSIIPNVNYSYMRRSHHGLWIGGFIDHTTVLNFPKTRTALFNNNPISYMLSASAGPVISYERDNIFNEKVRFRGSTEIPVLAYVIQPEYGHPYPEKYLEEGTFSPTREGLAGPLLKSGNVVSINKYRSISIRIGFQYLINNHLALSIDSASSILFANVRGKELTMSNFDSQLGISYLH